MDKEGILISIVGIICGILGLIYVYLNRNRKSDEQWRLGFIFISCLFLIPAGIFNLLKSIGYW